MCKCLIAVALICVLGACCGCFEYSQEIWVNKDYSGRIVADFGVSEQMTALGGMGGYDPVQELRQGYTENKAQLEADPNVKSASLTERSEEGFHYFKFDVSLKDITKLGEAGRALEPRGEALGGDAPEQMPPFEIARTDKGDINLRLALGEMAARRPQIDDPFSGMGQAMALSMLSGRYFTVTLHAPGPISGNGELSEDKRTATWKYSIAELFSGKSPSADIEARIDMPSPLLKLLLAAGVALALIAIVLIVLGLTRKRKPRAKPEYPTAAPAPPPAE
jgi:hypothetical protein